jgi:hypothetical protein
MDTLSSYTGLYSFLEKETAQEFPVNPLEPDNSMATRSNTPIDSTEAFQPGKPLITPAVVEVDEAEVCDNFIGGSHVVDGYFQNSKDYTTPCAENFEPTAWPLWPCPDPPLC